MAESDRLRAIKQRFRDVAWKHAIMLSEHDYRQFMGFVRWFADAALQASLNAAAAHPDLDEFPPPLPPQ